MKSLSTWLALYIFLLHLGTLYIKHALPHVPELAVFQTVTMLIVLQKLTLQWLYFTETYSAMVMTELQN